MSFPGLLTIILSSPAQRLHVSLGTWMGFRLVKGQVYLQGLPCYSYVHVCSMPRIWALVEVWALRRPWCTWNDTSRDTNASDIDMTGTNTHVVAGSTQGYNYHVLLGAKPPPQAVLAPKMLAAKLANSCSTLSCTPRQNLRT